MRKELYFIFGIVAVAIIANVPYHTDMGEAPVNDFLFFYYLHQFIKESMSYGQFPHWIPYYFGGMPYFANAQSMLFTYSGLLTLIMPTVIAMHLGFIIATAMSGIGMYLLAKQLKIKRHIAMIPALIFMINGWAIYLMVGSGMEKLYVYSIIPWVFLFLFKAFRKDWLRNSIIAGMMMALAFMGSGFDVFLWTGLMVGIYFLFRLISAPRKIVRIISIGVIFSIVVFGLVSIKLLPMLEFSEHTNKKDGFTLEQSYEKGIKPGDLPKMFFVQKTGSISYSPRIGVVAFILLLLSLPLIKNKNVLFLIALIVVNILFASSLQLYEVLWRFVPGFKAIHDVTRTLFITMFSVSLLAGFGLSNGLSYLKRYRLKKYMKHGIIIAAGLMIFLELLVITRPMPHDSMDLKAAHEENQLFNYLQEQPGVFRMHNIGTVSIGGAAGMYAIPKHQQILYGYNNVWIPEYFNVYLTATQEAPIRFFSMLNTKYIYHDTPLDLQGLTLVKEFERCEPCYGDSTDNSVDGPYLYENTEVLPRAYIAEKAILVLGEGSRDMTYSLMLQPGFDPRSTVIMIDGKLDRYEQSFLDRFDAIVLTSGAIDSISPKILKYVSQGGKLLPDLPNGQAEISVEAVNSMLSDYSSGLAPEEVEVEYYSPNRVVLNVDGKQGFLVLSEKYYMFDWKARSGGEEFPLYRANGINTLIIIDKDIDRLELIYDSGSFKMGTAISLIMVILIVAFFLFHGLKPKPKKK
ncbi:MAG: hypothetical protein KJ709_03100 [Nanoarchaeota archaeon]|nr:hypothetical protein [Nanoarchaeota archaeon]